MNSNLFETNIHSRVDHLINDYALQSSIQKAKVVQLWKKGDRHNIRGLRGHFPSVLQNLAYSESLLVIAEHSCLSKL